jgi:hypothetical protein
LPKTSRKWDLLFLKWADRSGLARRIRRGAGRARLRLTLLVLPLPPALEGLLTRLPQGWAAVLLLMRGLPLRALAALRMLPERLPLALLMPPVLRVLRVPARPLRVLLERLLLMRGLPLLAPIFFHFYSYCRVVVWPDVRTMPMEDWPGVSIMRGPGLWGIRILAAGLPMKQIWTELLNAKIWNLHYIHLDWIDSKMLWG